MPSKHHLRAAQGLELDLAPVQQRPVDLALQLPVALEQQHQADPCLPRGPQLLHAARHPRAPTVFRRMWHHHALPNQVSKQKLLQDPHSSRANLRAASRHLRGQRLLLHRWLSQREVHPDHLPQLLLKLTPRLLLSLACAARLQRLRPLPDPTQAPARQLPRAMTVKAAITCASRVIDLAQPVQLHRSTKRIRSPQTSAPL